MAAAIYRLAISVGLVVLSAEVAAAQAYLWSGDAQNPQHAALSAVASQPLSAIRWQTDVDRDPQYSNGDLLIHYGSPMITAGNLLVVPVKTTATGGFVVQGLNSADASVLWTETSDYVVPPNNSWMPPYSPTLTAGGLLYYPGAGGTVYRANVSSAGSVAPLRLNFYGTSIAAPPSGNVYIDTPITSDAAGNIYFGYEVTGTPPVATMGAGGIARISADGVRTFVSAAAATGDSAMKKAVQNCAPAITTSGGAVYVAVNASDNSSGYLLELNGTTLATEAKIIPKDPAAGGNAQLSDQGTASPTIGPDGDVYFGTLDAGFTSRGWLEHYSANLATTNPPGGFGWDNTASIVPASMVPTYHGASTYLLMTKYNNYVENGGGGQNMIAILDPNASTTDTHRTDGTGATIMQTVLTKLGPTPNAAGGVYEWCDNNAVVDPATDSVLVTSEDGHLYRWNLATDTLSQTATLGGGLGEAYTPTLIGPDGTVYAMNNGILHAIGVPLTTWTGAAGSSWDTASTNWASGSPAAATTYANQAVVVFGDTNPNTGNKVANTGGNVTIAIQAGGVQPAWITFTNTGAAQGGVDYTLGGGPIAGGAGITLAGTGGVGGAVYLTSANSFTGGVSVNAGRLNLQNSLALGSTSGVSVAYGAALELHNTSGSPTTFGLTSSGSNPIPLSLSGHGISGGGALKSLAGNNTFAGPISVSVASGGATIAAASTTPGDLLTLSGGIGVGSGATLTFTGPGNTTITGGGLAIAAATATDGAGALAVQGPGTLEIDAAPTFNDGTAIVVGGGTLRFHIASGTAAIGTGVTATVSSAATLELAGSISALASGASRANIITSGSSAGLLVSGTNQQVGGIDGSGNVTVDAGSDLTANHIRESALVIGGTAANAALVTIDASDGSGNLLVSFASVADGVDLTGLLATGGPFASSTPFGAFADTAPTSSFGNSGNSLNRTAVPEPSTLWLSLASAICLLPAIRRRARLYYCAV